MSGTRATTPASALAAAALADVRAGTVRESAALNALLDLMLDDDPTSAAAAVRAFFGGIIEPLGDSFGRADRDAYYPTMARMIVATARSNRGRAIGEALDGFGLRTEDDLVDRIRRISRKTAADPPDPAAVRRVFFLSRVTLGADVAVTGVGIRRAQAHFARARVILAGGPKLMDLFGGDPRLEIVRLDYPRRGGLVERLSVWLSALALFREQGFGEGDLLVDPDSRITQLGLLPLVNSEGRYHLFEGIPRSSDDHRPLGVQFGEWLDQRLGTVASPAIEGPYVALREDDQAIADRVWRRARLLERRVIAISLGVGGNEAKRLGAEFEADLLARLLRGGAALLLDKGGTDEERATVDRLLAPIRAAGRGVAAFDDAEARREPTPTGPLPDVVTWDGAVGPFAALLARASGYFGYDSLFQHVAAALGVPTVKVAVGYESPIFPHRWRPCGPAPVTVFAFGPGEPVPADFPAHVAGALLRQGRPGAADARGPRVI